MYANVLVAVDGGKLTKTIAQYVMRFPRESAISFVCAVDPNNFMTAGTAVIYGTERERGDALQAAQRIVDACVADATATGFKANGYVIEAEPVKAIIEIAAKIDADLIVMSTRALSGFARIVLGSVTTGVALRANIPVLLVPSGLAENDPSRHLHQIFQGK